LKQTPCFKRKYRITILLSIDYNVGMTAATGVRPTTVVLLLVVRIPSDATTASGTYFTSLTIQKCALILIILSARVLLMLGLPSMSCRP
jgi:hypothetical protein